MFKKLILLLSILILVSSCSFNEGKKDSIDVIDNIENNDIIKIGTGEEENNIDEKFSDIDGNEISEEEFNNSGSAKAIESETDLWNFYENSEVGFNFNYPLDAIIIGEDDLEENTDKFSYEVNIKEIGEGEDTPMSLSKEEEANTIDALVSGEFGKNPDFVFDESKKVVSVGNIFAQDYIVLSRFEVCDVTLEKSLVFYYNNKVIRISSSFPTDKLIELMPEYFTTDEANCFEEKIWDFDKQNDFYNVLLKNEAPEEIQTWFNDFNKISDTVIFEK